MLRTTDIAARAKITTRAVLFRAKRLKMTPAITTGRTHMWTPAQAQKLTGRRIAR